MKKSRKTVLIFTSDLFSGGVAESTKKITNVLSRDENIKIILVVYEGLAVKKSIAKNVKIEKLNLPLVKEYNNGGKYFSAMRAICLPLATIRFLYLRVKYKPDVVYSLMYIPNIINAFTSFFYGKSVLSERQNPRYDLGGASSGFKLLLRASYFLADRVHINSKGLGVELVDDFGVKNEKLFYFPNFFSFSGASRISNGSARNRKVVLLIGRMSKQKGFDFLPGIIKEVQGDCLFRLVTSGNAEPILEAARKLGVDSKLELVPERDSLEELYRGSHILLVTSLWESFGNVIVEAMSYGLPVVSNRCPTGPIEILGDGDWGCVTTNSLADDPVAAVEQIAGYISHLIESPSFYDGYSEKSIERARFYSEEFVVKKLLSCLYMEEVG